MRGYLRSPGHSYALDADVTSVGKGSGVKGQQHLDRFKNVGAHIPLESGRVERMHAVVEKRLDENCYVLMDLNSAYGTYVNEHRVQNGAVKLAPGDVIRFGHGGVAHEFDLSSERPDTAPLQKTRIPSPVEGIKKKVESGYFRPSSARNRTPQFDNITFRPDTAPSSPRNVTPPLSQLLLQERSKSVPLNLKMSSSAHSGEKEPAETSYQQEIQFVERQAQNGWMVESDKNKVSMEKEENINAELVEDDTPAEMWYVSMLRDKEQRLLRMGDEISRLSVAESESKRKDGIINDLRRTVAAMETDLLETKSNIKSAEKDRKLLQMGDEINRLAVFERECDRKDKLLGRLRDQVANLEVECQTMAAEKQSAKETSTRQSFSSDVQKTSQVESEVMIPAEEEVQQVSKEVGEKLAKLDNSLLDTRDELDEFRIQLNIPVPDRRPLDEVVCELKMELEEKDRTIESLEENLSEAQKELNLSHGLVQHLQSSNNKQDHKVMKLTLTLEKTKLELQEAHDQIQAMSNKFASLKEEKKHEELVAMMESELTEEKRKFQEATRKLSKQQDKIDKQSKELRRANRQNKQYFDSGKLIQDEREVLVTELEQLRKSDQEAKVSNEQNYSRLERLRSRIVQAVYTAPGSIKPESILQDADILQAMQKIIEDRSEFHQQLTDLGQTVAPLVVELELPPEEEPASGANESQAAQNEKGKSGKGNRKAGRK